MKEPKQLTHAQQDVRDEAYLTALRKAPKFTADKASLPLVAAILRDIHMRFFPHMRAIYRECGTFDMHRLHFYADAEITYVYTKQDTYSAWEIKGLLWSFNGQIADRAEVVKDFGPIMDEEALSERLREDEIEESGIDPLASECE